MVSTIPRVHHRRCECRSGLLQLTCCVELHGAKAGKRCGRACCVKCGVVNGGKIYCDAHARRMGVKQDADFIRR
jgi:hypothetical protein